MYDHRLEVDAYRERAATIRRQAAEKRREADELEAYAERIDLQGDSVHRLCTAGSDPPATCCRRGGEGA